MEQPAIPHVRKEGDNKSHMNLMGILLASLTPQYNLLIHRDLLYKFLNLAHK